MVTSSKLTPCTWSLFPENKYPERKPCWEACGPILLCIVHYWPDFLLMCGCAHLTSQYFSSEQRKALYSPIPRSRYSSCHHTAENMEAPWGYLERGGWGTYQRLIWHRCIFLQMLRPLPNLCAPWDLCGWLRSRAPHFLKMLPVFLLSQHPALFQPP